MPVWQMYLSSNNMLTLSLLFNEGFKKIKTKTAYYSYLMSEKEFNENVVNQIIQ